MGQTGAIATHAGKGLWKNAGAPQEWLCVMLIIGLLFEACKLNQPCLKSYTMFVSEKRGIPCGFEQPTGTTRLNSLNASF